MSSAIGRTLAAVLAAVLPAAGGAIEYAGSVGGRYGRTDVWAGDTHGLAPSLVFNGMLDASGAVLDPGILDWVAGVRYDGRRESFETSAPGSASAKSKTELDGLGYRASLSLFDTREARLTLAGTAARTRTDAASGPRSSAPVTGVMIAEAYGLRARAGDGVRPSLHLDASYGDSVIRGFGVPETRQTQRQLSATTMHGTGPFDYRFGYTVRESEGTLAPLHYRSHSFTGAARLKVPGSSDASIDSNYFLRDPTSSAPNNPRIETNRVIASWSGQRANAQYSWDHSLVTAPQLEDREAIQHALSSSLHTRFSDALQGTVTGIASFRQERLGTAEDRGAGQTVSGLLQWEREKGRAFYRAQGSATVGALEPASGDPLLAYGAGAQGHAGVTSGPRRYVARYAIDTANNLRGARSWSLRQTVSGEVDAQLAAAVHGTARLSFSGERATSALFGSRASRSVSFQSTLVWRRTRFFLEAGVLDGLSGALSAPTDGLFLPAGYDTHTRFAALSASFEPIRRLTFVALGRYGESSAPDVPSQREASASAILSYSFGYVSLALEDRYRVGGTSAFTDRANEFYVSISRQFSSL